MGLVHPYFDFDNEAFAAIAVKKLVAKTRRRPALLGPPAGLTYAKHTHMGFERSLREFGLTGVPLTSIDVDTPLREVREACRQLASNSQPPDGIICSALRTSFAVTAGFQAAGLKIGRDFDQVTKHLTELQEMLRPEIIAIPGDFHAAGHGTAVIVMDWLAGTDPATLGRLVKPDDK